MASLLICVGSHKFETFIRKLPRLLWGQLVRVALISLPNRELIRRFKTFQGHQTSSAIRFHIRVNEVRDKMTWEIYFNSIRLKRVSLDPWQNGESCQYLFLRTSVYEKPKIELEINTNQTCGVSLVFANIFSVFNLFLVIIRSRALTFS